MIAHFNISAMILYYELSNINNFVSLIDFEVMIKCAKHFDITMQRLMVLVKSKVLSGGIKIEIPQWLNLEAFTLSCKKVYQRLKALFEILPGAP